MKQQFLLVLAFATPAFAQDPATDPPPPPSTTPPPPLPAEPGDPAAMPPPAPELPGGRTPIGPVLPNMLPTRLGATVDVRADYTYFDVDDDDFDLFLLAMNFYASYLVPEGYGGYIQLPYWYGSGNDDSESGIGNLEVGGLYVVRQGPASEILLRGGIALDTAGATGSLLAPLANTGPRSYDAHALGLASMWGRGEGSFRHRSGNVALAASAGIDVPLTSDEDELFNAGDIDAIGKLAFAIGIDTGSGSLSVGAFGMQAFGVDDEDERVFGANVTAAFAVSPTMQLYGAIGIPNLEENFDNETVLGIGAGLVIAAK